MNNNEIMGRPVRPQSNMVGGGVQTAALKPPKPPTLAGVWTPGSMRTDLRAPVRGYGPGSSRGMRQQQPMGQSMGQQPPMGMGQGGGFSGAGGFAMGGGWNGGLSGMGQNPMQQMQQQMGPSGFGMSPSTSTLEQALGLQGKANFGQPQLTPPRRVGRIANSNMMQ